MNNHALLVIDYTNDFVADQGALSLKKPAQACENRILELAEKFRKNQQFVILPTDVHQPDDPYHPESKLFPTHNVRNTWGRCLYGGLQTGMKSTSNQVKFGKLIRPATAPSPVLI